MEESEKRRERLKAMRVEAAEVEISHNVDTSCMPGHLSNPFVGPSATLSATENSPAVARFDYYTDPMAAFSGNRRRSNDRYQTPPNYFSSPISSASPPVAQPTPSHLAGPRNLDMAPSPTHQYPINYSPDQRMYETPLPFHGSGSWRSPIRMSSPFPGHRGTPPGVWNRSGGTAGYGFTPNSSRGGGFRSPGFGRGGSPSPNSGRGSGRRVSNSPSPGSGWSGGRGRGFHACVSARERPELFYNKSMVEDPWRLLKPVVRSLVVSVESQNTPDSRRSWLPKSISMKKARVSETASEVGSQSSLAEYLAAAFEAASNDGKDV